MQTDALIQSMYSALKNIKWRKFESDSRIEWYYAENMLYVVHDNIANSYYFIKAKSPESVLNIVESRVYS